MAKRMVGSTKGEMRAEAADIKKMVRDAEAAITGNDWDYAADLLLEVQGVASSMFVILQHQIHIRDGVTLYDCDYCDHR